MTLTPNKRLVTTAIVTALTSTAANTEASVTSVSATPTSQTVPFGQSSSRSLIWNVTDNSSPGTSTVSSNGGTFRDVCITGTALGAISTPLSSSKPGSFGNTFHNISETVLVPSSVVIRAQQSGASAVFYERTFTPGFGGNTGCERFDITSSAAAGFSISREALSFDNGAPVRVLEKKQPLRANAEINFNGSGMLQAQWEVADPTSSSGQPTFRSIGTVRQYLVGSDTQTISSPTLPTEISGLHLARLRITDPAPGFDMPVIRYFVADSRTAAVRPAVPLGLTSPPNQMLFTGDTVFAWDTIPGARAYQLEIYAKPRTAGDTLPDLGNSTAAAPVLPQTPPVAGMIVTGAQTRTALSESARTHLVSGQNYLWRVLAIGTDGNVIGESAVREVRMP